MYIEYPEPRIIRTTASNTTSTVSATMDLYKERTIEVVVTSTAPSTVIVYTSSRTYNYNRPIERKENVTEFNAVYNNAADRVRVEVTPSSAADIVIEIKAL